MSDYRARYEGRACTSCGVRRGLFRIYVWLPERTRSNLLGERVVPAHMVARAHCVDRAACRARIAKRKDRAAQRAERIQVTTRPGSKADCAKPGHCSWCGEPMLRVNKAGDTVPDRTRAYHRAERGEPPCRDEADGSYCWDARVALRVQAKLAGETELRCADCGAVCEILEDRRDHEDQPFQQWAHVTHWDADHEVPLEDGGEHTIENLRCRCVPDHKAKTARESAARARSRR